MPDYIRRRLLAAMATSPLWINLSAHAAPPDLKRIIALEWLPLELLMALGVTPMAAADTQDYRIWVGEPKLPDNIIEVGLRTEPNLELLTQLKPSLLLYSQGYGPSVESIARIAPGMAFSFNEGDGKPLTAARHSIVRLGKHLGLEPRAHQHLKEFDAFIADARARLASRVQRPLLLMSLIDARHAIVFGQSSLFLEVMEQLGIENAWQEETNFWGSSVIGLERLAAIKEADVICFAHNDDATMRQIAATPLWQSFAFVRQQRFRRVPAVWFYGATLTAMHFCRTLEHALEAS